MVKKGESSIGTKEETNRFRTNARVVGLVYLAGFMVGMVGNGVIESKISTPI